MSTLQLDMEKRTYIVHPQKFALWLFILTVIMIFGGLTSGYIVQRSFVPETQQIIFDLPVILWTNLAVILFSSVSMQLSLWFARKEEHKNASLMLLLTLGLGVFFLVGQLYAWGDLTDSGLPFVDKRRIDNSVSYFYVFTGLHGLHIVAALIVLLVAIFKTTRRSFLPGRRLVTYEMATTFWHFLGVLWVYLFIFLKYTQA
ncbi:MAG: cytochrome c oxidase subunit 3 [Bacteroidota bacterium]